MEEVSMEANSLSKKLKEEEVEIEETEETGTETMDETEIEAEIETAEMTEMIVMIEMTESQKAKEDVSIVERMVIGQETVQILQEETNASIVEEVVI